MTEVGELEPRKRNALVLLLILVFAAQAFWHAWDKSQTYDELAHITTSFLLCKTGGENFDAEHPSLLRYFFGIPLLLLDPGLPQGVPLPRIDPKAPIHAKLGHEILIFGAHFLYQNRVPADRLLLAARAVNIALGCVLAWLVFRCASFLYGDSAGFLSLTLFAFCPNLIAHSSLATTDVGGTLFAVAFIYFLIRWLKEGTWSAALGCGAMLGLALLSKMTNLLLLPVLALSAAIHAWRQRAAWRSMARKGSVLLLTAWLVLCAGYRFGDIFVRHRLLDQDWHALGTPAAVQKIYSAVPLPDSYLRQLMPLFAHNQKGHPSFLFGRYSLSGWRSYFPLAFLVKTPTVPLLLCLLLAGLALRRRFQVFADAPAIPLALVFFGSLLIASRINIGIRHMLVFFPLIHILLGQLAAAWEWTQPRLKLAVAGLFLLVFETFLFAPNYLAFFNLAAGGPGKGIDYLSDSNIDWGQDLRNLARYLEDQGNPELVLSYFGTAVPQYYGIRYQALPSGWSYPFSTHINSPRPGKEFLAVSVSNLQGTYFNVHDLFGWLKSKEPIAKIGYSIYVYDVTDDAESQRKLLEIYEMNNKPELAARQKERLRRLGD